ncbi:MAG TPA: hypothetical protein DCS07_15430 [Bdellovibrionales bacterium]|nr:MAG: hypothetical protein A2Z97_00605 [Bdellovibrionales bacterium GWB1_52_6]OFZ03265.1 MAG: hypothetical protein A2X97_10095 [Bdellovibrionales bacterium GWA1_52_35]OFZ40672.1 MAG: hypothetical protein A2070_03785 [Bdellovibrionales bacterium GWC1_52_8]HAR44001.1 hypothetical protein [Bdellovibrionales bacterium]HCM40549.1 hypothetical protein [Bdellovibrionales bacterium]
MSGAVDSGQGGKGKGGSQDFDLNLAPIIDSFTVLIAFMLVSASFLSIGILDAGISAAGVAPTSDAPPSVNLTVEVAADQQLILKLAGKSDAKVSLAAKDGKYDLPALTEKVGGYRKQWTDLNAVTLVSADTVQYKDVVQIMEALRKNVPVVLLGGF